MPAPEIAVAYVSIVPSLQGFQTTLRTSVVQPADRAGDEAGKSMSEKLMGGLKKGAAAAGAAAGVLIAKGLIDAVDQSNIKSKLQAQLGATGKDAAKYGKVAGKLYSTGVTESFESAAEAIKHVMQSGIAPPGATNAQLQSIAAKASDLASTFDQDLGGVTNAVSQMLRTGLAKNATEAFDIITKGLQSGANKADDLLDTFNEYGTQFRKLGLDGPTALGLIQQGIQGGARDADIAADALKEFAIRAVDGSATTIDGFKALGLSAEEMQGKIIKGGPSAAAALALTLDKLRAMTDPSLQAATAVKLFGTQAEDLGAALYKLDPTTAAKGIGQIAGAADQVGASLRSGPSYELQVFQRRVTQAITEALGKYAIPTITQAGRAINTYFVPALQRAWQVGSATFSFLRDAAPWLIPLAIAVGGLTLALNANAIATGIVTGVFAVYRTAILIGTAITNGFAGAQALLNAVMALNPFVLIVIAIAAFVAALVVAYNKSETFRAIVQAAFSGIKTAISAVGSAALWLWNTVLSPVFSFIGLAARILATAIVTLLVLPAVLAFKALAATGQWLWGIFGPVLTWIGDKIVWLAVAVFQVYFGLIKAAISMVAAAAIWLYDNAINPAFDAIAGKAQWIYASIIKPQFLLIQAAISALGAFFGWLYSSAIQPATNAIGNAVGWLWNNSVRPAFEALKTGVSLVGKSFEIARDIIGAAWGKLADIAKKPIAFIIDHVYNDAIVGVWNAVAGAFGAPKLSKFNVKGFATGGILPGYTPGRDVHLAALSGGEAIMRPEWTRAMGPGYVNGMNALARQGGVGAVRAAMGGGLPAFKDGGIFGWIGSAGNAIAGAGSKVWDTVKKGAGWLTDTLEASARAGVNSLVNPLLDRIPGLDTGFGQMVKRIPTKIVDAIFGYSKEADSKGGSASMANPGGAGVTRWTPYVIKALAANGLSTSGDMVARVLRQIDTESGGNPNAIQGNIGDINNKTGDLAKGLMQTISATFNAYKFPGHGDIFNGYDNLLAALNYAKHRYGPNLSFLGNGHGYDSGGWLQPGATMAVNKTGKPEPILNPSQWANVATLANRGAGGGLQPGDRLVLSTGAGTDFEVYIDQRADSRIHAGLTAPAALGRTL